MNPRPHVFSWLLLAVIAFFAKPSGASASSTADEYIRAQQNSINQMCADYGVMRPSGANENVWSTYQEIWNASGGPVSSQFGVSFGRLMNRATWVWFILFSALFSASVAQKLSSIHEGNTGMGNTFNHAGKLVLGLLVGARPDMVYASAMTLKDSTFLMVAYGFDNNQSGVGYALERSLLAARILSPDFQRIQPVLQEAVLEAYRERAGVFASDASLPAVVQVYNEIAAHLRTIPDAAIPGRPAFSHIDLKLIDGSDVSTIALAGWTRHLDTSPMASEAAVPANLANGNPNSKREYSAADIVAARDMVRGSLPEMIIYLASAAPTDALAGVKVYQLPKMKDLPNGAFQRSMKKYLEMTMATPTGNTSARGGDAARNVAGFVGGPSAIGDGIAVPAARMDFNQDVAYKHLEAAAQSLKKLTHTFMTLAFTRQFETHPDAAVVQHYRDLQGGVDIPMSGMAVKFKGVQSIDKRNQGAWGSVVDRLSDYAGKLSKLIANWLMNKIYSFLLEAYIFVLWLAFPFLLLKQTSKAFTGALNTLLALCVVPSAFCFLMVVSDLVLSNMAYMLTYDSTAAADEFKTQQSSGGLWKWTANLALGAIGAVASATTSAATALFAVTALAVAKFLMPFLCMFMAGKVAKAFFAGDSVVSAAAAPVAAAAIAGVAAAVSVVTVGAGAVGMAALKGGAPAVAGGAKAGAPAVAGGAKAVGGALSPSGTGDLAATAASAPPAPRSAGSTLGNERGLARSGGAAAGAGPAGKAAGEPRAEADQGFGGLPGDSGQSAGKDASANTGAETPPALPAIKQSLCGKAVAAVANRNSSGAYRVIAAMTKTVAKTTGAALLSGGDPVKMIEIRANMFKAKEKPHDEDDSGSENKTPKPVGQESRENEMAGKTR